MSAFDLASTAKAIHLTLDEAFVTVPEGRTNVVVIDGTYSDRDSPSARLLWAHKTESGWNIITEGSIDKPHGLGAKVATIKSW